jgi:preprotein translocase subunit SecE
MAIKEDIKPEHEESGAGAEPAGVDPRAEVSPEEGPEAPPEGALLTEDSAEAPDAPVGAASPAQLGTRRFVYAAYFAGAIGIAFIMSKALDFAWYRLQTYRPSIGEPRDEVVMPVSALVGAGLAVYYWVRTRARELAEQVATEMSKVTWPSRTEVTNGTFVVIVTTVISTVFFALMDKFWGFVTNLVYGGS